MQRTPTRRHLLGATLTAATAGLSLPVLAQSGTHKPTSLRLTYTPNAEHAPYYLGLKKGFYRDEGLELTILPGTGSNDAVKLVGAGNDMFGVAVSDSVVVGRGRSVPVVAAAVLLQQSPNILCSLATSHLAKPEDLYGRKFGTSSRSTVYAFWQALVQAAKLDVSKITVVDLGATSTTAPLIAGAIDATINLATNEKVAIEAGGFKLNTIDLGDYGIHTYGQVLFTQEALAKKDPDTVRRMTRATLKSWQYTMDNVPEAIAALKDAVPVTDVALESLKWVEIIPRTKAYGGANVPFGHQDVAGWTNTYATFKTAGLIDADYAPADIIAQLG